MILDAATLLTFFDREAAGHWAVAGEIELAAETEQLLVSPFVMAELEAIMLEEYGPEEWLAALEALAGRAWTIPAVTSEHLAALIPRVASGASLASAAVRALVAVPVERGAS